MTQTIDETIGHIIRVRRQQLGYSQEALAKLLGITFQQVQKYEKGRNALNTQRLVDMAEALEVSVSYLFAEHNIPVFKSSEREGLEMMKAFGNIDNPAVRKRFSDLARALCGEVAA